MASLFACVASLIPTSSFADSAAQDALEKMAKTYLAARSYQDTGAVTESRTGGILGAGTQTKPFRTFFTRPNLFYYQFTSSQEGSERRYVVWADGKRVRSWWTVMPEVREFESIGPALYGPLGVSGGSAHTIPRLLLADSMTTTFGLTQMGNLRMQNGETLGSTPCIKITGSDAGVGTLTVWLGKRDFLVRKIIRHMPGTTITTSYQPRLNVAINRRNFSFNPPR